MTIETLYKDYPIKPYISPERDIKKWLSDVQLGTEKIVPKRNMIMLENKLLPGDIILLWRIGFGTFTSESVFPKYFEYTYGICGQVHLDMLIKQGYVIKHATLDSLQHVNGSTLRSLLKLKNVSKLSVKTKAELEQLIQQHYTESQFKNYINICGYQLTLKGQQALQQGQSVVDKHPKKGS